MTIQKAIFPSPQAIPHYSEQQRELWRNPGSPVRPCLVHSVGLERAERIFVMLLLGVSQLPWKPGRELEWLHALAAQGPQPYENCLQKSRGL